MTCEEFCNMLKRQPADCSVAEIAAGSVHVTKCKTCQERLKAATDETAKRLSPLQLTFARYEADLIAKRVTNDHEALAMLIKAEQERQ